MHADCNIDEFNAYILVTFDESVDIIVRQDISRCFDISINDLSFKVDFCGNKTTKNELYLKIPKGRVKDLSAIVLSNNNSLYEMYS